jgi:alpha-L-arabinofuranosidase
MSEQGARITRHAEVATIRIDLDHPIGQVDRLIYGHFLESNFFGNIEGGVFDEAQARKSDDARAGLRRDVIEVCRGLGVPIVRWPGGNFASAYHWEDAVGPRARRPRRLDLTWGGEESNLFGTDEFLAWCADVGAEPYLVNGCRNVEEAVRWVEYTNYGGDTAYSRARAANGHPEPYGVRYWGVGNEVYGHWQMGHRPAAHYAADAREHASFMRAVDPSLSLVAVGRREEEWMRPLISVAGECFDFVSLHLYGASTHLMGGEEFGAVASQSLYFEQEIAAYSDMVADLATEAGIDRPMSIALDEWNIRHLEPQSWPEPMPGDDGGFAPRDVAASKQPPWRVNRWSQRTLADALFYAGVFHAMHRLCGRQVAPRLANTVNLVNANALLAVRAQGVLRGVTYHVWDLYQNRLGDIALPTNVTGPNRYGEIRQGAPEGTDVLKTKPGTVPYLDVVATRGATVDCVKLAVINRHPTEAIEASIASADGKPLPRRARIHCLGADIGDLYATNTFSQPDRVAPRDLGDVLIERSYVFAPHSITVLDFGSR